MNKKIYYLLLIFLNLSGFSQKTVSSNTKLDSIKKYKLIYAFVREHKTHTEYENFSGEYKGSTSTRGIFIDFRIGTDGPIDNIGKKGKYLKDAIKDDPEALAELNRAYKVHLRRKKFCNFLEYFGYGVTLVSAVPLFIGLDDFENDGVTTALVGGGIGVVAGIADIFLFYKLTEKHMNAYTSSVLKSIEIYNKNKLNQIK